MDSLRQRLEKKRSVMQRKLLGSRFRMLNEDLYTNPSEKSLERFQNDPSLFDVYHEGFRAQVEKWPENPLDRMISLIKSMPKTTRVADLGCGEARLAQTLASSHPNIHSFDLVSPNSFVIACDIAKVPLSDSSVDVALFCLALMGTNYLDFLREAHRILCSGGKLFIAEVTSRITSLEEFARTMRRIGFAVVEMDDKNTHFVFMSFRKDSPTCSTSSSSSHCEKNISSVSSSTPTGRSTNQSKDNHSCRTNSDPPFVMMDSTAEKDGEPPHKSRRVRRQRTKNASKKPEKMQGMKTASTSLLKACRYKRR